MLRNYHLSRVLAEHASVMFIGFSEKATNQNGPPKFYESVVTVPRERGYTVSKIVRGSLGSTPLPVLNYTTDAMKAALADLLSKYQFDIVQLESIHLIEYLPIIRRAAHRPIVICDWHNVESELMQRYSEREGQRMRKVYANQTARKLRKLELRAMGEFDAHIAVSRRDAEQLREQDPAARVFVIENGVDAAFYSHEQIELAYASWQNNSKTGVDKTVRKHRVLFVASMDYHANIDAAVSFAREVWPGVHERKPNLIFTMVGRDPSPQVRQLELIPGVEVTGTVEDVRPFYREALVSVVPLKVGGGSRLKILEAMAAGVPVVSTTLGAEGIDVHDGSDILLADSVDELSEAIINVAGNEELARALARNARAMVSDHYEWSKLGASLLLLHQELIDTQKLRTGAAPQIVGGELSTEKKTIKLLAVVEATTVNAVAKNMLEFYRAAEELQQNSSAAPRVELSLVTFNRGLDEDAPNEFVRAARGAGIEVDDIPERWRFDLKVIPALRKVIEARAPDLILTHSVKSHFLLWRSQLWQNRRWIAFHHGYTTTDHKMRLYNQLDRWSLPRADRVITVCQAFASELESKRGVARDRIIVQHNSSRPAPRVSDQEVAALRRALSIGEDERIVLAVGRLSREKAHADLLKAFRLMRDAHLELNLRLVIAGEGPERANLERLAESLGIKKQVIFAGQVNNVQTFYAAADILVNPSHSEGSPYVLLEAMAAGVPIVATAVGGVPEILTNNENALLVNPNDYEELASTLVRLLKDSDLADRLRAASTTRLTTQFSPKAYAQSMIVAYWELIHTNDSRR